MPRSRRPRIRITHILAGKPSTQDKTCLAWSGKSDAAFMTNDRISQSNERCDYFPAHIFISFQVP